MYIVILVTAKDMPEADRIISQLIAQKQVACANVVPAIESSFMWKGRQEKEQEVLILLKTKEVLFKAVEKTVKALHSYSVPEIIAFPIVAGNQEYLDWIDETIDAGPLTDESQ